MKRWWEKLTCGTTFVLEDLSKGKNDPARYFTRIRNRKWIFCYLQCPMAKFHLWIMSISKYAFKKCPAAKINIVRCPRAKLPLQEIRRQGGQRRHLRCVLSLSVLSTVLSTERLILSFTSSDWSHLVVFYSIWILKFAYQKIKGTHPLNPLTARAPPSTARPTHLAGFLDVFSSWWLLISFNSNPLFLCF
jgi:hypothetical protein